MTERYELLKVVVGSYAHELAVEGSDHDYRGVYAIPTSSLVGLGQVANKTHWTEGDKEDDTSYELGHFLHLAQQCNPSILEVFRAPVMHAHGEYFLFGSRRSIGNELRELFQYIWEPKKVAAAFGGYSHNQQKKALDNKDGRREKFMVAHVRVLLQGLELLWTGDFSLEVTDRYSEWLADDVPCPTSAGWRFYLQAIRGGGVSLGDVIDCAEALREVMDRIAERGPYSEKFQGLEPVNEFLVKVRRELW